MAETENITNSKLVTQPSEQSWVVYQGENYLKQHDKNGDYIILGGTQKKYLAEIKEEQKVQAYKNSVEQGVSAFFDNQIDDFKNWSKYYEKKIAELTGKIQLNQSIFEASQKIVLEKDLQLNPLYKRNDTNDYHKFWFGNDKKVGKGLYAEKRSAKHDGNVASSLISSEQSFIESYRRLMNHSNFCLKSVKEIAQNTFKNFRPSSEG